MLTEPAVTSRVTAGLEGVIDSSFKTTANGKILLGLGQESSEIQKLKIYPDGKILALGRQVRISGEPQVGLYRLTADGSPDHSFGELGALITVLPAGGGEGSGLTLQADEKILVTVNPVTPVFMILRYLSNGTLDTSWGTGGIVQTSIGADSDARAVVQVGNYIYVGGTSDSGTKLVVARYDSSGVLDPTYGTAGIASTSVDGVNNSEITLSVSELGEALLVGRDSFNSPNRVILAKWTPTGVLDSDFDGDGIAYYLAPTHLTRVGGHKLQSTGKIIVAAVGEDTSDPINYFIYFYRLNTDGSLDNSFGSSGIRSITAPGGGVAVFDVAIDSTDRILATGENGSGAPWSYFAMRLTSTNGELDTNFAGAGFQNYLYDSNQDADGYAIALQPNGKIILAGDNYSGGVRRMGLMRLSSDGILDSSFGGHVGHYWGNSRITFVMESASGQVYALGISNDKYLVQRHLPSGDLDPSFGTGGRVLGVPGNHNGTPSSMKVLADGKLLIVGTVDLGLGNNAEIALLRLNSDGTADTTFDTDGLFVPATGITGANIVSSIWHDDSLFVLNDSAGATTITQMNLSGSLNTTFGVNGILPQSSLPAPFDTLLTRYIAIQADGKIVLSAEDISLTPILRNYLLRLDSTGAPDATFGSNGITSATTNGDSLYQRALLIQSDQKILLMYTYDVAGESRSTQMMRFTSAGSLDTSYGLNGIAKVESLCAHGIILGANNTLYLGGHTSGMTEETIAAVSSEGQLVSSFGNNGKLTFQYFGYYTPGVETLGIQSDGKLLMGAGQEFGNGSSTLILRIK